MDCTFINNLKAQLKKPLPGKNAQFLMSPSFRIEEPIKGITTDAAVLLLLYPYENKWTTVFMKRAEYDGIHSGQISFPGGRYETCDNDFMETALRETEEEFGFATSEVTILGKLTSLHIPISQMVVHPYVGHIPYRPDFKPDPGEVQYLIEVSLEVFSEAGIRSSKPYENGSYKGTIPYFNIHGKHHVWGATAMILSEFLEILKKL